MPSKKPSIYISSSTQKTLDTYQKRNSLTRSKSIKQMIERYDAIIKATPLPRLTAEEEVVFDFLIEDLDTTNVYQLLDLPRFAETRFTREKPGGAGMHEKNLIKKLKSMTATEIIALIEFFSRGEITHP